MEVQYHFGYIELGSKGDGYFLCGCLAWGIDPSLLFVQLRTMEQDHDDKHLCKDRRVVRRSVPVEAGVQRPHARVGSKISIRH